MLHLRSAMKKKTGIWLDHKEALMVSMQGDQATVERLESEIDSRFRPSGGRKSGGTSVAQSISREQRADERYRHQCNTFYKTVIDRLNTVDDLFIFGPGGAKHELVKAIEKIKNRRIRISAVEPCDRLTENQVVAKVKSFFSEANTLD